MISNTQSKILCIGDTVCDVFIKLIEAQVSCDVNNTNCTISMRFGDKIPFESETILYGVGNSANAAVSCARLGMQPYLITHLGDDDNGKKSLAELSKNGVLTYGIVSERGVKTNYHYVLWYPPERTILIKHEHFMYNWKTEIAALSLTPDWVYFSSVGSGTEQYHDDICNWLTENPSVQIAFQPGTFQIQLGVDRLRKLYLRSQLFFCNVEEAFKILGNPGITLSMTLRERVKFFLVELHKLGPKTVVITDGANGAYSYDGEQFLYCPMYPDVAPPLERTGAGDAYASAFTAYYANWFSVTDCMLRAPINSMNVVQHIGAQAGLLTHEEIASYLAQAPETYKVLEI